MRAFVIVIVDPFIEIALQRLQIFVDFLAKGNAVEFIVDGLVEAVADAAKAYAWQLAGEHFGKVVVAIE